MGPNGKPFSCEKCHSPFIVSPARSHRLDSRRKYNPRKITDVVTKQVLLLCNACGLSMVRSKKERHRKVCLYGNTKTHCSLVFVCSRTEQDRTYCRSIYLNTEVSLPSTHDEGMLFFLTFVLWTLKNWEGMKNDNQNYSI
jgi:hypothetical protein